MRLILTLAAFALFAADASACGGRGGPVRNLIGGVVENIQDRRAERQQRRAAPATSPSCSPAQAAPGGDCPDGTCPLRRPVALSPAAPVVYDFPRRMP